MKSSRKKNLYFGFGKAPAASKRERSKSRRAFQAGVERKRKAFKRGREKEASTLFRQLQKDAKPQRARRYRMSPSDEAAWKDLLKSNPRAWHFPGGVDAYGRPRELSTAEVQTLRNIARANMASKKRKRSRRRNSRKGKMPAGLKAYWAKKRRAKAKRKNPRRRRTRTRTRTVYKIKRVYVRPKRRRRRASNPRRRRASSAKRTIRLRMPSGISPNSKAGRAFVRLAGKAYGAPARIVRK